ncbi:uncharacterized protein LOC132708238 [Cylas formicarius]|uniref:uncharacterized protein LOC132708238 n=1 Tax=Cylas formicarius TaxID=197179 RepID=UPI002958885F|nr:uncharacterized protein LOC132708238 [Cylas formicarius]
MTTSYLFCVGIILITACLNAKGGNMLLKFQVIVEMVLTCPNNARLESPITNLKSIRYNRTYGTWDLDYILKEPIDGNYELVAKSQVYINGAFKDVPLITLTINCNNLKEFFWHEIIDDFFSNGTRREKTCPIPAGNFYIRNWTPKLARTPRAMLGGKFKTIAQWRKTRSKKVVFCIAFVTSVVENLQNYSKNYVDYY